MLLKSLQPKQATVTVYSSGVCYINSELLQVAKEKFRRSLSDLKFAIRINEGKQIVLLPWSSERDARKVSHRGGGGSFSCRELARVAPETPFIIAFRYNDEAKAFISETSIQ